ncbi:hypothetical protein VTN77DRAFT_3995 [Rasamsonia byssochlamydoides]|uniref:uncharacterized protein n=1 Tax=Rasamsonia byssochlamydoides TaxID=89139 RepID=UPI0037432E66
MIVLSRDEPDIRRPLEDIANEKDIVCLRSGLVDEDIGRYIRHRLTYDKKLRRWQKDYEIRQEIETQLMEKAQGMFRWAACQMDILANCLNRSSLRKALKNLPKTLGDTYERILSTIDDDYRDYALTILQWLAFSTRPLYANEAAEIVAITADDCPKLDKDQVLEDPFDVLTICPSLVTVIGIPAVGPVPRELAEKGIAYEQPAFTLAHYSVKEYLVSETIQKSPMAKFSIQEAASQAFIAKCCLGYILQFRQRTSISREMLDDFQLAEYAAQFWPYHVRAAGDHSESVYQLVMELLSLRDDAYLNWFRLYDIDTEMMSLNLELKQLPEPLYSASAVGLTDVVRLLIADNNFDINRQSGVYGSALQAASIHGYDETVDLLLDMGAHPNIQSEWTPSALQVASAAGHLEVVEKLLQAGADSNLQSKKYGTALQAASVNGHMEIVEKLIGSGADVNVQGGEYGTALMGALVAGHHAIVNKLLEAGADIHLQGGLYDNTLQAASCVGENELIRTLLKTGADVNKQGGRYGTALQAAAFNGHARTVELLLEAGADVNIESGEYGYALQAASANNHGEIVTMLLNAGADVNAQGGKRFTALHAAIAEKGEMGVIERLLRAGADINVQTYSGNALHTAARVGRKDVVVRLLKEGADIDARCEDAGSVLLVAMWYGRRDIAELLLKMGADINADGRHGSVRQLAAQDGYSLKAVDS